MRNVSSMEALYRDYSPKGVQFHFVYKALAHPEKDGYVNPVTKEERLLHIKEAKRMFEGVTMPWLCDNMDSDLKRGLGGLNNPDFLFDPEGKIVKLRDWNSPSDLRADLEKLVGPVEKITTVSDLNLKTKRPKAPIAKTGVVERIKLAGPMQPIKAKADKSEKTPFYAKLRAEVDSDLMKNGSGKLYMNFNLDPLLNVCWNNLAEPIEYKIVAADGTTISPTEGKAAKVEVESDSDPREFLIDIEEWKSDKPLKLKFATLPATKKKAGANRLLSPMNFNWRLTEMPAAFVRAAVDAEGEGEAEVWVAEAVVEVASAVVDNAAAAEVVQAAQVAQVASGLVESNPFQNVFIDCNRDWFSLFESVAFESTPT